MPLYIYIHTHVHVYIVHTYVHTGSINVRDNGTKVYHYLSYAARSNLLPSLANRGVTLDGEGERERETEGREFLIFIGLQTGEIRPAEDPKTRLRLTLDGHERNARRTRRGTLVSSPRFFVPRYRTSFARRPAAARLVTGNGRKRESNGDFTIGVGRWVRSKRYDIA